MKIITAPLEAMLYRISTDNVQPIKNWPEYFMEFNLVIHKPNLFSLSKYGFNPWINLIWYIITYGRVKILLLFDKETLVHSFYITPKTYRYGYMNNNDINLAQAMTSPSYRGKGILTNVLKLITGYYADKCRFIWVYCDTSNLPSQKANTRAGFKFISYVKMSRLTRIVRLVKKL